MRTLRGPVWFPLRALATGYVDLFRGLPLIICLYLVGFGLPGLRLAGIPNNPVLLGGLALVLVYSAYVAEVFRAGIESVHPSQLAAATSLGLNYRQTMRLVVLPQAARRVTPALLNDFVALQKDCGLISVLGAVDAVRAAQIQVATSYNFTPYVVAGLLFVALAMPVGAAGRLGDAARRDPAGCAVSTDRFCRCAAWSRAYGERAVLDGRRPRRRRTRGRRADRGVRVGQVDAAAVRRPARGHRRRADPPRRPRHQRPAGRRRRGPPRRWAWCSSRSTCSRT